MYSTQVKLINHVLKAKLFTLVRHGPSHTPEIIDHSLGHITHIPIIIDAGGVFSLAELTFVGISQQWHMTELRHLPAKIFIEEKVFGC